MDITIFNEKFRNAIVVLKKIEEAGFEAYFVGGCVRDYLLGEEFSDIDITTNALPEEVKLIFKKTIDTGLKHGTVTILENNESYEITTFRTEMEYSNHRSPDKVEFVKNLKEDLDRRDFSINAMALDSKGTIYDFHNGREDLEKKIIKTVNNPNERFHEDALRMLRAFRFSSKLGFSIQEDTLKAIENNAKLIKFISIERIVVEFKKLLSGKGCEDSLTLLLTTDVNKYIPFLKDIKVYRDFSNFTFCQSLYYLSYYNNIDLEQLKLLKLSNAEIKKIIIYNKIKTDFDNNENLELILYKYLKSDVKFIAELFNIKEKKDIEKISLIIESFNDIAITSKEIIKVIGKKPGPWIKKLTLDIERKILLLELKNRKEEIIDFLLKVRDTI